MIWLAAAAVLAQGMTLPPLVGPIRLPGETFEVSVSRTAGFSTPPILAPLRGADVLGPPLIRGGTATWRVRATGGPCELRCYALAPQDAAFLRVPVLLDVPPVDARPPLSRPMRTGKPRAERPSYVEAHLPVGSGLGARFVETTVGPGLQWVRDGRVVGSFAPLLVLEGNSGGAPDRLVRFVPDYRYLDPLRAEPYVRFLGEVLDMWRLNLVLRPAGGTLSAELELFPLYDGRLARIALGGWHEQDSQLRTGKPLRIHVPIRAEP